METETQKYIDQQIRESTKEIINFNKSFKEDIEYALVLAVDNKMEAKFNGKMEKMDKKIEKLITDGEDRQIVQSEHTKTLKEIQEDIKPILKRKRDWE